MKKVLGIDLGSTSIGWALIEENETTSNIIALGSRIIPLSPDEKSSFKGTKETKNQQRTLRRSQRRGYYRYTIRRRALKKELSKNNLLDENYVNISKFQLWELRAKAVQEKLSLSEIGRVLLHLNQKRGYQSIKKDNTNDKKESQYLESINNRYEQLKNENITIGQKFYKELSVNEHYRIKEQVYPRIAYIEEFDQIMKKQKEFYPTILTDDLIKKIRDGIIYFQRPLKSQKHLVSICDLEGRWVVNKGEEIFIGPKVAPKSSPLFQIGKIWETINNIKLKIIVKDPQNNNVTTYQNVDLTIDKKKELFEYLNTHEVLSKNELFKILEIKSDQKYVGNKLIEKGIQGNQTLTKIKKALEGFDYNPDLLKFDIIIKELNDEAYLINKKSGEIIETKQRKIIDESIEKSPLYQLWHTIYSIKDENECKSALKKRFGVSDEVAEKLSKIDFNTSSFGNKSNKAIRKILPYLMEGYVYSDAASFAGYNHSFSLTKDELSNKKLKDKLDLLPKNSLRQPIVEKILNQLINLINEIINPINGLVSREDRITNNFEIRIELARELKESKEERMQTFKYLLTREEENKKIKEIIENDYHLRATSNNILKWRLFHEIQDPNSPKINATCIYCGKQFGLADALSGDNVDIEHIIPKSLRFDDSQANKTLSHRSCNAEKGNRTAYDYMKYKGENAFNDYVERVNILYKNKLIGNKKKNNLLTPQDKLEQDFIERQLRETQYIARKSREILSQICYNVWTTSGTITSKLRFLWGWNDVIMDLQLPKYKEFNKTEFTIREDQYGNHYEKEVIPDWSKRNDNRHHAIDALTIACTRQGFIQRINTLSAKTLMDKQEENSKQNSNIYETKVSNLEKYLKSQIPFSAEEVMNAASRILISFKAGQKVATYSVRKQVKGGKKHIVQTKILTPRGALTEESVYGKIKIIEKEKPLKYIFENPDLIIKNYIKNLVKERLALYNNDSKLALSSLKNQPIFIDPENQVELKYASCYKDAYVLKYPISTIKPKDTEYIVDLKVKELVQKRLEQFNNNPKEAFKEPLYFDSKKKNQIKTIRLLTNLSEVEPLKKNENGEPIAFVKPGNNHHIALYYDENNKLVEHICTFWHAVQRKKFGIPVIIKNPKEIWDLILKEKFDLLDNFLEKLPPVNLTFSTSMQQYEMFILGMDDDSFEIAYNEKDYSILSQYLYRVQKLSSLDYTFRHHLETNLDDSLDAKNMKKFYRIRSINSFQKLNPKKVKISLLGELRLVEND